MASVAIAATTGTILIAVLAACSGGDPGPGTIPPATAAPATTAPATTTLLPPTTAAPPTTVPGPLLSERVGAIEVSARWSGVDELLAVAADASLAEVAIPEADPGRVRLAARCSPVDGLAPSVDEGLVVRVVEPVVDRSAGGLTGFELVATGPMTGSLADPAEVSIRFEIDGEGRTTISATAVVDEDPTTGSFRGELADGSVIEGAYRCG